MDAASSQKILGYFIEESKEHLETIERGLLDLANLVNDTEQMNEMFRAAHSVKGGAAMLGYNSIQKTAHRLEDAFKILKENRVSIDQKLESLFLKGYDTLNELIDKLQGPFGLQNEEANAIVSRGEPTFTELQNHLNSLLAGESAPSVVRESPNAKIRQLLKQMLQVFKQGDSPATRQQLQQICAGLNSIAPSETRWQNLVNTAKQAIANPKHSYYTLAPVVIGELKKAGDLLELDRAADITTDNGLQQLAGARSPHILVPLEPKALAGMVLKMFDRQQVAQLVQLLQTAK
ncbi:Hpt domain-containing protein [Pannus brasiliensis CCIBt3594]|uniref:Hpt domain-containing protein n=1 Tax=Pannus brasiliensis CCIBt3594 TaxID=1427578 RepID=A0AAW9QNZ8_9CHRO